MLALLFVSCETSENAEADSAKISSQLIGSWELVEITSEDGRIGSNFAGDPNYFEILYTGEASNLDVSMTFAENPNALDITGEGFQYDRTVTHTSEHVETEGDKITDQWTFAFDFLSPGTGWKVEEQKYLYDDTRGSLWVDFGAEILELNETTLLLKMDYRKDFPKTGWTLGTETNTFHATFEKQ